MPTTRKPRKGSMQYWPRKRARRIYPRINNWAPSKEAMPLGFAGYKVGMTHIVVTDNRPKALTKGEEIPMTVTILECPPLKVAAIKFYKSTNNRKRIVTEVWNKVDKTLGLKLSLQKKEGKKFDDVKLEDFDDLRLLVYTQPSKSGMSKKKPELFEIAVGGKKEEQLAYAKESFSKDITASDALSEGEQVDIHSVTRGKGHQGPVKRFGISLKSHKSEKKKRGAPLGPWTPSRILPTAPLPGQLGFFSRVDYNKQVLKISNDASEVAKKSGFKYYGLVKSDYILIKGSVPGPVKRLVRMKKGIRVDRKLPKEAPAIEKIIL